MDIINLTMRDAFLTSLYGIAKTDSRVILLSDDLGAPSLDAFKTDLPGQYINMGIAEQNIMSVAAGLALGGKIVYAYGIAPFMSLRCFEQIKIDICCNNVAVTILSVGAGYSYGSAGPTHHAVEDISLMSVLPGITILNPSDNVIASAFAQMTYRTPGPKYVRIDRAKLPIIYDEKGENFSEGLSLLKTGADLTIIGTGLMVHRAVEVAEELAQNGIDATVVDLYRIKPINVKTLIDIVTRSNKVVTIEENLMTGGIGNILAGLFCDCDLGIRLKRFAIPDTWCFECGERAYIHEHFKIDTKSIVQQIIQWFKK